MNLITAENRELALSMSINQRNPHEPDGPHMGVCYLALTFGTLLSSQGADVQRTRTLTGLRPWRLVPRYAVHGSLSHPGGSDLAAPGPSRPVSLGAKKKVRGRGGRVKPGGRCKPPIGADEACPDSETAGRGRR